jgi:type IV pilus assembly protein PilM
VHARLSLGVALSTLKSLFRREAPNLLGLDVSTSSVKLVELSRARTGEFVLERCASETLEPGWVRDGTIEKFDEVTDAIRRVVRKSGTKSKDVSMALPASAVITKKISLPDGLTEVELEVQVESEARQYIPFSIDEVSLDFQVLGPSMRSSGDVEVLIAAARKEKVAERQNLAEGAGLTAVVMDVDSFAGRLAVGRLTEDLIKSTEVPLIAVFEVGAYRSTLQVLRGDEVLYERDQSFGGAQLTQLIERKYGFSQEEAEVRKRAGDLPDDYNQSVLAPFVESLSQEVGRALQFFFSGSTYNRLGHVYMAGGSASLHGLPQAVSRQTACACSVINPFEGMQMGPQVSARRLAREAPSYLTATGLALRRFFQ